MGRKSSKKFIDKKNAATFHLMARDTFEEVCDTQNNGHVFVRVDNNTCPQPTAFQEFCDDEDYQSSIFADASEDRKSTKVPDKVRKEILELGLPDDGYNYLLHLRDIKNSSAGSYIVNNPHTRMDLVPLDVKAYDASKVRIKQNGPSSDVDDDSSLSIAKKIIDVKLHRAIDEEVAKLLEDGDLSVFGSDNEDLEEDFVVKANLDSEEEQEEEEEVDGGDAKEVKEGSVGFVKKIGVDTWLDEVTVKKDGSVEKEICVNSWLKASYDNESDENEFGMEELRPIRPLDKEFDLLALREYDVDSDDDFPHRGEKEVEALAVKLNSSLKERLDGLAQHANPDHNKYIVPRDSSDAGILRKCAEYAEMYSQEDEDKNTVVIYEESSDESVVWDCESILTTHSNFDNHPGIIQNPVNPRKKNIITLKGKEKLPVDFLPNNKKVTAEKVKKNSGSGLELPQKKRLPEESKEEKKQRKNAVKEEKREARRSKKELKSLYKCEGERAQKVAAFSGPSTIHLM